MIKHKALLAAAVVSMVGLTVVRVAAEDQSGQTKEWNVTYDGGNSLVVDWEGGASTIQDAVNNMQPGDEVTFNINLHNKSKTKAEFYMLNEVLKSFEEGDAKGGAYSYDLNYRTSKGENITLYSSQGVGGEDTSQGEGLEEATNALDDYIFLEEIAKGKSGVIELTVGLDGETLMNNYQETQAKINMLFAVELPPEPSKKPRTEYIYEEQKRYVYLPNTGDNSHVMLYAFVFGASLTMLLYAAYRLMKVSKEG